MIIRKGTRDDVPQLFDLVTELALFEKAHHELVNTPEQMLIDGFGDNPLFGVIVAEDENKIVGMSLYYFRYSTWKGKRLYLEDLIVREAYRGQGIGKALLEATREEARQTACTGMMWQVLDWNEPAVQFYKQFGARIDAGWWNCHVDL